VFEFGKIGVDFGGIEGDAISVGEEGGFSESGSDITDRHADALSSGVLAVFGPEKCGNCVAREVGSGPESEESNESLGFSSAEFWRSGGDFEVTEGCDLPFLWINFGVRTERFHD